MNLQTIRKDLVDLAPARSVSRVNDRRQVTMDAFEQLAADILANDGYWVRTSVKVALTREDKAAIARPSSPRWEIDLVAYSVSDNQLLLLECKSYLDSGGVHFADLLPGAKLKGRYKLFHDEVLRATVFERLRTEFIDAGRCPADVRTVFGLVYGHASENSSRRLIKHFAEKGWRLFGPDWLSEGLHRLASGGYENSSSAVVAKLLRPDLRDRLGRAEPSGTKARKAPLPKELGAGPSAARALENLESISI